MHLMRAVNAPETPLVQISAGRFVTCALDLDESVHCWGQDTAGSAYEPEGSFVQISANDNFATCAVRDSGSVLCWGQFVEGLRRDAVFEYEGSFSQVTVGDDWLCAINVSVQLCAVKLPK